MSDLQIWWIRHGESTWNRENRWQGHSDIPLSQTGQEQAQRLARALQQQRFDLVFSSDLQRARQTAEIALPGVEVVTDPRLREVHFGHFEGLTREEMSEEQRQELSRWLKDPFETAIPGGESLAQVYERLCQWRSGLPTSGKVAVFTHGGVIRCSLWKSKGNSETSPWRVQIANCSTTCIRYSDPPQVEWINDLSYQELS